MITVETPLRSVQSQREALLAFALQVGPESQAWIDGALAVLWWMEYGGDTPIEQAAQLNHQGN